jgi:hypothetical protein
MADSFGRRFPGYKKRDIREVYATQLSVAVPQSWALEAKAHLDLEQITLSDFLRRAIRNELDRLRV